MRSLLGHPRAVRRPVTILAAVLALVAALGAACGGRATATGDIAAADEGARQVSTDRAPTSAKVARAAADVGADPLLNIEAADPLIVVDGGRSWVFMTDNIMGNVPVARSLGGGFALSDALPVLPDWAEHGQTWAPSVASFGDRWVLAFTASDEASRRAWQS